MVVGFASLRTSCAFRRLLRRNIVNCALAVVFLSLNPKRTIATYLFATIHTNLICAGRHFSGGTQQPSGIDNGDAVTALRTLENKGLVVRQRHPTDARVYNVYLTRKARQMEERLKQRGSAINVAAAGDLDPARLGEIKAGLRTIYRNLSAELKQTKSTNHKARAAGPSAVVT